jgi:hypothetical protein
MKRAIVIDNLDPKNKGRVKFRFLGDSYKEIPDTDLQWAEPIHVFPGALDSGSWVIPPKGAIVFVFIEDSDYYNPFYIGCWNNNEDRPLEGGNAMKKVIYKSEAGAMVYIDDTQGSERLRLVDRMGQVIEMFSAAKESVGKRGSGNEIDGGGKDVGDSAEDVVSISITGLGGVKIELVNEGGESSVNILSEKEINIVSSKVKINNGEFGVHTAGNHPICNYTGAPLNGEPSFTAP